MNAIVRLSLAVSLASSALLALALAAASAAAQSSCPACIDGQTYRIVYKTVCEQQQYTAYRIEYENVCEERQVISYKPVWETAVRENRYTVARPVVETAEREEVYTVQRPVYETAEREETYTVMRPVYETAYRTEYHTVLQPVVTCQTQYVDRGFATEQVVLKPGLPATRLTWQSGGTMVDPVTGQTVYRNAGLYWTQTPRGQYEVQRVWHPNVVAQQIPQTSYVQQTVAQQVPMQVCRYVPEQVVRKVPVQVCRMVVEQQVRRVPVTTCRTVYEERVEQVPYQVCRMVAEQQTIRVPHVVEKRIPVTYTYNVPRVVCYRIPLNSCGEPIAEPAGAAGPATSGKPATGQPREPTPAQKPSDAEVKPSLPSGTTMPRPVETEERKQPPMTPVPPMKAPTSGDSSVEERVMMSFRVCRRPRIAMLLISVCAVASVGAFQGNDVWRCYARNDNGRARFVAKYEPLRPWLPADEVVRFVIDEPHIRSAPAAIERLGLAMYAVAPRWLAEKAASRWVVVDSDCPEIVPEIAVSGRWTLIVDLHNGVRLYRTDAKGQPDRTDARK